MRDLESVIAQFEERSLPFQAACTNSFESVVNNKRICFAQASEIAVVPNICLQSCYLESGFQVSTKRCMSVCVCPFPGTC